MKHWHYSYFSGQLPQSFMRIPTTWQAPSCYILGWPKTSHRFSVTYTGNPEWTFWPTQYSTAMVIGPTEIRQDGEEDRFIINCLRLIEMRPVLRETSCCWREEWHSLWHSLQPFTVGELFHKAIFLHQPSYFWTKGSVRRCLQLSDSSLKQKSALPSLNPSEDHL